MLLALGLMVDPLRFTTRSGDEEYVGATLRPVMFAMEPGRAFAPDEPLFWSMLRSRASPGWMTEGGRATEGESPDRTGLRVTVERAPSCAGLVTRGVVGSDERAVGATTDGDRTPGVELPVDRSGSDGVADERFVMVSRGRITGWATEGVVRVPPESERGVATVGDDRMTRSDTGLGFAVAGVVIRGTEGVEYRGVALGFGIVRI